MTYKAVIYPEATDGDTVRAYSTGDVIVNRILVRGKSDLLSVFVKFSVGAATSLELYESVDGSDWRNATALAAYESSSVWSVLTFRLNGAESPKVVYPAGTLLQLRCVTAGITVDRVLVVQDV